MRLQLQRPKQRDSAASGHGARMVELLQVQLLQQLQAIKFLADLQSSHRSRLSDQGAKTLHLQSRAGR